MKPEEGGDVSFWIVLVQGEAVILGDLPPQGFAAGRDIGLGTHTARYDPSSDSKASCLPRRMF
jgi:hypothetical protein